MYFSWLLSHSFTFIHLLISFSFPLRGHLTRCPNNKIWQKESDITRNKNYWYIAIWYITIKWRVLLNSNRINVEKFASYAQIGSLFCCYILLRTEVWNQLNNIESILILFRTPCAIYTTGRIIDKLSNMEGHHESNTVQITGIHITIVNYTRIANS